MTAVAWTRSHDRLLRAWQKLDLAHFRFGLRIRSLDSWLGANFGETDIRYLTRAQCRKARRSANAWRHSMKGGDRQ